MPKVPEYTPRVGVPDPQSALPRVGLPRPDQPLNDTIARESAKFIGEMGKIAAKEEARALDVWVAQQKSDLIHNRNDLLDNPEDGLYSNKYRGNHSSEAEEHVKTRAQRFYDKQNRDDLSSKQKEILQQLQIEDATSLDSAIAGHTRAEKNKVERESFEELFFQSLNEAYRDPGKADQKIAEIRAVGNRLTRIKGLTGEAKKAQVDRMVSTGHIHVISGFADSRTARGIALARAHYKKHKKQMTKADAQKASDYLEEVELEYNALDRADKIALQAGESRTKAYELARKIKPEKVRIATENALARRFRQDDYAEQRKQENLFEKATKYTDKGNPVPGWIMSQLKSRYRDALKARNVRRKTSDLSAVRRFQDFSMEELAEKSPQEIEVLTSAMTPADRRYYTKRYLMAVNGDPGFSAEKDTEKILKDRMVQLEIVKDHSRLRKGRGLEYYMGVLPQVKRELEQLKIKLKRKNLTGDEIEGVINNILNRKIMVEEGALFWKKEVPIRAFDPDVRREDLPGFERMIQQLEKDEGIKIDDALEEELRMIYIQNIRRGKKATLRK